MTDSTTGGARPHQARSQIPTRIITTLAGIAIIGASTWSVIAASHPETADAARMIALGIGLVVGSATIGAAIRAQRKALAGIIGAALLLGEMLSGAQVMDRVTAQRDKTEAVVRRKMAAHNYAVDQRTDAQQRYDVVLDTARNQASRAVKDAAAASVAAAVAVQTQSSLAGCRAACITALQANAAAAEARLSVAETSAAAVEDRADVRAARADLDKARRLVEANPKPEENESPTAARLGISAAMYDLVVGFLSSVVCGGLGAGLVAFGCHTPVEAVAHGADRDDRTVSTPPTATRLTTRNNGAVNLAPVTREPRPPLKLIMNRESTAGDSLAEPVNAGVAAESRIESPDASHAESDGASAVYAWIESLSPGVAVSTTQRGIAERLRVSLGVVQRQLAMAKRAGKVSVATNASGTTIRKIA